jgi:hypothetical protein
MRRTRASQRQAGPGPAPPQRKSLMEMLEEYSKEEEEVDEVQPLLS